MIEFIIFGGSGFIGSHFVRVLKQRGISDITVADIVEPQHADVLVVSDLSVAMYVNLFQQTLSLVRRLSSTWQPSTAHPAMRIMNILTRM